MGAHILQVERGTRREFLKRLGAVSAAFLLTQSSFSAPIVDADGSLDLLIVGDSLVWGQGLEEKDKFYTLTAEWLRKEAYGKPRQVDLKVKAHSGAALKFHGNAAEAYKKINRDETYPYKPELNIGFPSIWKQLEVAAVEYKAAGRPNGADLILLNGGLTDITIVKLLDPFGDDSALPGLIEKHCRDDMFDVLEHASALHPNALIAVIGYFPIMSEKTPGDKLFNGWLETMKTPLIAKPLINNPLVRGLYFNKIRKKVIGRSKIWFEQSSRNTRLAVDRFNAKFTAPRALFVPSPITDDTALETPHTLLFKLGKYGRSEDPLYLQRQADCRAGLTELKRSIGLDYPVRYCEIAAIGHPNPAGSRAYADAINAVLGPELKKRRI